MTAFDTEMDFKPSIKNIIFIECIYVKTLFFVEKSSSVFEGQAREPSECKFTWLMLILRDNAYYQFS